MMLNWSFPFEGVIKLWDKDRGEKSVGPIHRAPVETCWPSVTIPNSRFTLRLLKLSVIPSFLVSQNRSLVRCCWTNEAIIPASQVKGNSLRPCNPNSKLVWCTHFQDLLKGLLALHRQPWEPHVQACGPPWYPTSSQSSRKAPFYLLVIPTPNMGVKPTTQRSSVICAADWASRFPRKPPF